MILSEFQMNLLYFYLVGPNFLEAVEKHTAVSKLKTLPCVLGTVHKVECPMHTLTLWMVLQFFIKNPESSIIPYENTPLEIRHHPWGVGMGCYRQKNGMAQYIES